MELTPPQTMLVWALSGDLWFGRRELLLFSPFDRPSNKQTLVDTTQYAAEHASLITTNLPTFENILIIGA